MSFSVSCCALFSPLIALPTRLFVTKYQGKVFCSLSQICVCYDAHLVSKYCSDALFELHLDRPGSVNSIAVSEIQYSRQREQ